MGFLGAGVILRNGVDVQGVTTAATLWCAAAIGCLAGAGQTPLAVLGALVVVGTNAALRPVSRALDRYLAPRRGAETPEAVGDYLLEVVTTEKNAARVRAMVVADVSRPNLVLVFLDVRQRHEQVVVTAGLRTTGSRRRAYLPPRRWTTQRRRRGGLLAVRNAPASPPSSTYCRSLLAPAPATPPPSWSRPSAGWGVDPKVVSGRWWREQDA